MITFTREPPEWSKLSRHGMEGAEGYIVFTLYGHPYCVALTPDMKKVCGISRDGGRISVRGGEAKFEKMLMRVADSLYLQIRDTVGAEVGADLSRQLTGFLEEKFDGPIRELVGMKLEQGLLPAAGKEEDAKVS